MRRAADEPNINEYLTSYLKYFKASFNAQLSMIQSLTSKQQFVTLEERLTRVKQAAKIMSNQIPQLQNLDPKINLKTLQRFCLRINQYMEYRVTKTKNILQKCLVDEVMAMCSAMHRLFSDIGRDRTNQQTNCSINSLFSDIGQVETKYMSRIAKRINQIFNLNKATQNSSQIANLLTSMRVHKSLCQSVSQYDENFPTQKSIITTKRIELNVKPKFSQFHYAAKLRSRKSTFERVQSNFTTTNTNQTPISISNQGRILNVNSHILLKNLQNNLNTAENQEQGCKNIEKYSTNASDNNGEYNRTFGSCVIDKIKDVFQTESNFKIMLNKQELMKQLLNNNRTNEQIIQKYRKKALKHRRNMEQSPRKQQESVSGNKEEVVNRHKRAYTLDASNSKKKIKKQERMLQLPLLKRKSIKM